MSGIWNRYFSFKEGLSRGQFWKGILWMTLFTLPVSIVIGLSAHAGPIAIIVFVPGFIFLEWMYASLLVGRLTKLGANKYWVVPMLIIGLIPLVGIGYLVVLGCVDFGEKAKVVVRA